MTERRVLVFPGGTEIGLEIRQSLAHCKEVRLFSAADSQSNHAPFAYECHIVLPPISEDGWLDALNAACEEHRIDYIFGAHEDVLLELARHRDSLRPTLVASPTSVIEDVRSKRTTYSILTGEVRTPRVFDRPFTDLQFPVFVKPDRGAGSRGAALVANRDELEHALSVEADMIVCEYVPGVEMTVDCFSDREEGLLFCGPRVRLRMRNGISMDSLSVDDDRVRSMAEMILQAIPLCGAWFFQVREGTDGDLRLLEVGARIAGTMAVHRCKGVNFALLSILEMERMPIAVHTNPSQVHIDRALVNRYAHELAFQTVYVDLDDTLVVRGRVNTQLVAFLYQCVNDGKRVVIVTRHAGDLDATLRKHRLSGIADEVIHLDRAALKSTCMTDTPAIFIDDSFGERMAVHRDTGMPTFDCSMIEMLLDDRA